MKKIILPTIIVGVVAIALIFGVPPKFSNPTGAASGTLVTKVSKPQQLNVALVKDFRSKTTRVAHVDTAAIEGLIEALEARGAKVDMSEHELDGNASLKIKVDGLSISPVLTRCKNCEPIVFEY